jgi:recombination DNA repair RAD52 pathway protein
MLLIAGKMVYVEGHTIINLANKLFGFNGWSSEIRKMETDYVGVVAVGSVDGAGADGILYI